MMRRAPRLMMQGRAKVVKSTRKSKVRKNVNTNADKSNTNEATKGGQRATKVMKKSVKVPEKDPSNPMNALGEEQGPDLGRL